jgi:lauroyl/myristoyl acyltransferase
MSIAAAGLGLVRALPVSLAVAAARLQLLAFLLVSSRTRAEVRLNSIRVLGGGGASRGLPARLCWRLGHNLALMAHGSAQTGHDLLDNAEIRGENILERIMLGGCRVVVLSMHFGLWEYLPWLFARLGHEVTVGQGDVRDVALRRLVKQVRSNHHVTMTDSLLKLRLSVRNRRLVGFVLDNTSRTRRLVCDALGLGMKLLRTPFVLARLERAVLVPILAAEQDGRLRVEIHEPVRSVREFGLLVRRKIRERPEEWVFWGKA